MRHQVSIGFQTSSLLRVGAFFRGMMRLGHPITRCQARARLPASPYIASVCRTSAALATSILGGGGRLHRLRQDQAARDGWAWSDLHQAGIRRVHEVCTAERTDEENRCVATKVPRQHRAAKQGLEPTVRAG